MTESGNKRDRFGDVRCQSRLERGMWLLASRHMCLQRTPPGICVPLRNVPNVLVRERSHHILETIDSCARGVSGTSPEEGSRLAEWPRSDGSVLERGSYSQNAAARL